MNSVFADQGWLDFVRRKQGVQHRILTAGTEGTDTAFAQMLVFVNNRGKLRTPKLMQFMPVHFQPTQTTSHTKLQRQWLTLGGELANMMDELGYGGSISVDPSVTDVRPWQWRGIRAEVRYTYHLSPDETLKKLSSSKRKSLKKTESMGYTADISDDLEAVLYCLRQSEDRQGFETGLSGEDLTFLNVNSTPGSVRFYLVWDSNGEPVSARAALAKPGHDAIGLVAGTAQDHLKTGAAQLSISATLTDLQRLGVTRFDFGGANIESVALAKMQWGGELVPFYTLSELGPRSIALQGKRWLNKTLRGVRG